MTRTRDIFLDLLALPFKDRNLVIGACTIPDRAKYWKKQRKWLMMTKTDVHRMTPGMIEKYREHLVLEEKSQLTIEKYLRDVQNFYNFLPPHEKRISKEVTLRYKEQLIKLYAVKSVNSMLTALNQFLCFEEWNDCRVKLLKVQRQVFCDQNKELTRQEYLRLLSAAREKQNQRLYLLIETICSTGIRVSELQFITVQAVKNGKADVFCKGKGRTILLPKNLRRVLVRYVQSRKIKSGMIFVTRSGRPLDRSNIWSDMKKLCVDARVSPSKVFPHNLRHLFARTFYNLEKDITRLADILGHSSIDTTRIYIVSSGIEHERQISSLGLVV